MTQQPPAADGVPPASTPIRNTHEFDDQWGGYYVNGIWSGANGDWTVQQSGTDVTAVNTDDTWVGIGGNADDCNTHANCSVIQLGTEMRTNVGYRSWFEYICATGCTGTQHDPQYGTAAGVTFYNANYLRPGDQISALVYWASTTTACFSLIDSTRSTGSFSGCVANVGMPYDRNSMEWIDENHINVGYALSDFGATHWTNQEAFNPTTGAFIPFTNYGFAADIMILPPSTSVPPCSNPGLLAYPSNASAADGGSSTTIWCREI